MVAINDASITMAYGRAVRATRRKNGFTATSVTSRPACRRSRSRRPRRYVASSAANAHSMLKVRRRGLGQAEHTDPELGGQVVEAHVDVDVAEVAHERTPAQPGHACGEALGTPEVGPAGDEQREPDRVRDSTDHEDLGSEPVPGCRIGYVA